MSDVSLDSDGIPNILRKAKFESDMSSDIDEAVDDDEIEGAADDDAIEEAAEDGESEIDVDGLDCELDESDANDDIDESMTNNDTDNSEATEDPMQDVKPPLGKKPTSAAEKQAHEAAKQPLPPGRGEQKRMTTIMKRPAGSSLRREKSKLLGEIVLHLCTHKSYICGVDKDSGKEKLVVEFAKNLDHKDHATHVFEKLLKEKIDKAGAMELRRQLETGELELPGGPDEPRAGALDDVDANDDDANDADESDDDVGDDSDLSNLSDTLGAPWWDTVEDRP